MTLVLGLMGAAGAGKSTVAKYLEERFAGSVKRYSLADPLKELVMRAFDLRYEQCYGTQAQKETTDPRYSVSPRWLLQRIGTEGARAVLGDSVWTDACLRKIERESPPVAIIEDVRFVNEAVAVRSFPGRYGGIIWRLEVEGDRLTTDAGTHASEQEWARAPFDAQVRAPISPFSEALKRAVERAVENSSRLAQALKLGR